VHRETCAVPAWRMEAERARLHRLLDAPHTAALGITRVVNTDQTIWFGSVRYSVPPGLVGAEVWVRADGDELVAVADLAALPLRPDWAGDTWPSLPTPNTPPPSGSEDRAAPLRRTWPYQRQQTRASAPALDGELTEAAAWIREGLAAQHQAFRARMDERQRQVAQQPRPRLCWPQRDLALPVGAAPGCDLAAIQTSDHSFATILQLASEREAEHEATD
jgi:hypothetical protein